MKQPEAMEYVRQLLFAVQRIRSVNRETLEQISSNARINDMVLEDLMPWVHGPKGDAFLKSLDIVWSRGYVSGQEFYNFMAIIHNLQPNLADLAGFMVQMEFPEPTVEMIVSLGI